MSSPYENLKEEEWLTKTQELIDQHPLDLETIRRVALKSWDTLWRTTIGEGELSVNLWELDIPSTVVGYFFEKLFAKELETENPKFWRGGKNKEDKDIVYIPDSFYSVEIKSSGQLGLKVFGNRSYGQNIENIESEKKEKSGYYITVNFYEKTLNLIRFGWIDHTDWKPQTAQTGQQAFLRESVYKYKLLPIEGDYRLNAPIGIIDGIGEKTSKDFSTEGVKTVRDLKNYQGNNSKILKFRDKLGEYEN